MQNSESIAEIADKFGVSVKDLIKVNASKVHGKYPNAYFYAGEEIKIPRKIDADDSALQGRKSRNEVITEYEAEEEKRLEEARREEEAKKAGKIGKNALTAKRDALIAKFPDANLNAIENLTVLIVRAEACGLEVSSDVIQSLIQTYCLNGEFNTEEFCTAFFISLAANILGHSVDAAGDIRAKAKPETLDTASSHRKTNPSNIRTEAKHADLQKNIDHIFEKHSVLNATDVHILREYIKNTDDINVLSELKKKLKQKETTYGGTTSDYKTLYDTIDRKIEVLAPKTEPSGNTQTKTYDEMTQEELFEEYKKLKTATKNSRLSTADKAANINNMKAISVLLERKGYKIENNRLVKINKEAPESGHSTKESEFAGTSPADSAGPVHKPKFTTAELRQKLGDKLYSIYQKAENMIKELKTLDGYNKAKNYIKAHFNRFGDIMTDLLDRLETAAIKAGIFARKVIYPGTGSKYFRMDEISHFVNEQVPDARTLYTRLLNLGCEPTRACAIRDKQGLISMYDPNNNVLYTFVFDSSGKCTSKSKCKVSKHADGSYTRHSELCVDYEEQGNIKVSITENDKNIYSKIIKAENNTNEFTFNSANELRYKMSPLLNIFSDNTQNKIIDDLMHKGLCRLQKNGTEYLFFRTGNTVRVEQLDIKTKYNIQTTRVNDYTTQTTCRINNTDEIWWAINDKLSRFSSKTQSYVINKLAIGEPAIMTKNGIQYEFSIDKNGKITIKEFEYARYDYENNTNNYNDNSGAEGASQKERSQKTNNGYYTKSRMSEIQKKERIVELEAIIERADDINKFKEKFSAILSKDFKVAGEAGVKDFKRTTRFIKAFWHTDVGAGAPPEIQRICDELFNMTDGKYMNMGNARFGTAEEVNGLLQELRKLTDIDALKKELENLKK